MARTGFQIQRDVIYALLLREMASRFGKSRVGLIWVLLEPIAHLVFPLTIFAFIRNRVMPGFEFPVFLIYGFLPFLLFKAICLQTMEGTNANRGVLAYRQVLLMDVFIAKALAQCATQAIVFAVVITGVAMLGYDVAPVLPLELSAVLLLAIALAFGLGLLFAAIGSLVPDARTILRLLFVPLYFMSGILFPITRFPDEWQRWLAFNPVLHLVEASRVAGLDGYEPTRYFNVGYPISLALISTFLGLALYRLRILSRVTT